jgi:hypothetical protein
MTAASVDGPQWLESSGIKGTAGIKKVSLGGSKPFLADAPPKRGRQPSENNTGTARANKIYLGGMRASINMAKTWGPPSPVRLEKA